MEYLVIAFRSRAHTVKFSQFISSQNIANEIINTPKEAGVGCGLSVKVSLNNFERVKRLVCAVNLNSFAGFFLVRKLAGKRMVKSI